MIGFEGGSVERKTNNVKINQIAKQYRILTKDIKRMCCHDIVCELQVDSLTQN